MDALCLVGVHAHSSSPDPHTLDILNYCRSDEWPQNDPYIFMSPSLLLTSNFPGTSVQQTITSPLRSGSGVASYGTVGEVRYFLSCVCPKSLILINFPFETDSSLR